MSLDEENVPGQNSSRLRWALLLAVAGAAIMWPCITELRATGSETFTGWESTVGDKESDEAEDLSQSFRTAAKRASGGLGSQVFMLSWSTQPWYDPAVTAGDRL